MRPKAVYPKPLKWKCWRCEDTRASTVRNGVSKHEIKLFDAQWRSFGTKMARDSHERAMHKDAPPGEQQRNTVKRRHAVVLARIKAELQLAADAASAGTIV